MAKNIKKEEEIYWIVIDNEGVPSALTVDEFDVDEMNEGSIVKKCKVLSTYQVVAKKELVLY